MKMTQSFEVSAPPEVVWEALIDPQRIAPCLPGATITDQEEDGSYQGEFKVKLGPTTANYRGTLKIAEADEETRRATLNARGTDKRGQGGATATIVNSLEAIDGGTRVTADTDFSITGRLASFGRGGMIEDISNRLLKDFATCLQAHLEETQKAAAEPAPEPTAEGEPAPPAAAPKPPPIATPSEPLDAGNLVTGVVMDRVKANPAPLIGMLVLLLFLLRRRKS